MVEDESVFIYNSFNNYVTSDEEDFCDNQSLKNKGYEYWENLSEESYRKIFKNSAVKRTKYSGLKRNITTAKEQISKDG